MAARCRCRFGRTGRDLDVQEGLWEVVKLGGEQRVRPVPGFAAYDRILNVTGAFSGARRVGAEIVFRRAFDRPFGFGVLHLWGGHPDQEGYWPRRGWLYGMAWYMSLYGVGIEISAKYGAGRRNDVLCYRSFDIEANTRYRVIAECWPEFRLEGTHRCFRQRMKWWRCGEEEPESWLETTDLGKAALPEREYSVALMAHNCEVEFAAVSVEGLSAPDPSPRSATKHTAGGA